MIADFVKVYVGHARWRDLEGTALRVEGDRALARQFPSWIRLDKVVGRDFPVVSGINRQRGDISPGPMHAAVSQR
jgi:hypothetical protein